VPASQQTGAEQFEILPLMIVAQAFPARPSSLPDVRDLVRRQLTSTPLSDDDVRTLCDRVADVLLDAAGIGGSIQVSLRIFPACAEVDVLFVPDGEQTAGRAQGIGAGRLPDRTAPVEKNRVVPAGPAPPHGVVSAAATDTSGTGRPSTPSFAAWLAAALRREGLTMEAAARRLDVSTKTISRWVGGTTEPRLRDLYRIREVFGEPPFG
jgi:hypothetical protein